MSKTQELKELIVVAQDAERAGAERLAALNAADEIRKGLKIGWVKFGVDFVTLQTEIQALVNKDQGVEPLTEAETQAEPPPAPPPVITDPKVEIGEKASALADEITEALKPAPEKPKVPKAAKKPDPKDPERGKLSAFVRNLLATTDLPYSDIVAKTLRMFPGATTTTRSVASVASDMRKKGETVAMRRAEAKS